MQKALDKKVRLALEYPEQNGFVLGHPKLLKAALQKIIDNALDASPPGSVLTLRIHITDNHIQIIVRDQGSGIPKRSAVQNHHTVCYKQTGRHWIWAQF